MSNRHNEDVGVDEDYVVDDRKTDGIRQRFYDDDEDDCELFTTADKVGIEPKERERERDCSYSYPCRYSRVREDAGTERGRTVIGVGVGVGAEHGGVEVRERVRHGGERRFRQGGEAGPEEAEFLEGSEREEGREGGLGEGGVRAM